MIQPIEFDRGGLRGFGWYSRKDKLKVKKNPKYIKKVKKHNGHDYYCPLGAIVKAVSEGEVIYSSRYVYGYGGWSKRERSKRLRGGVVWILHLLLNGEMSVAQYGHVSSNLKVNDIVSEDDFIGRVHSYFYKNSEGNVFDIPHLHFAINTSTIEVPKGNWGYVTDLKGYVNPKEYLKNN